ncbi:MAG: glycosyltransferase [Coriobacteriia bacterium]
MIDVSIIIVTYNSARFLRPCLDALSAAAAVSTFEIIVVDNASTDDSVEIVQAIAPEATILKSDRNGGFAYGCNKGISAANGSYVVFLNPDAVAWPHSIDALVTYMDATPLTALAGPRLHEADGSLQFSQRNFPAPGNQFFEAFLLHRAFPRLTTRAGEVIYDAGRYEQDCSVDWISGAVMIARPEALAEVSGFDESYFMYSEEKDLCQRLATAGWNIGYAASSDMTHSHDAPESAEAFARQLASKLTYFDKHLGVFASAGCKAGLFCGFGLRIAAGSLASLFGSPRGAELLLPAKGIRQYLRAKRATGDGDHQGGDRQTNTRTPAPIQEIQDALPDRSRPHTRRYAVLSTVRNEQDYIAATAKSLTEQTIPPACWHVVDDGSTDRTVEILDEFVRANPWISVECLGELGGSNRCSRVMRAFLHGYSALGSNYDYVVKVDGDVTFPPDHFERLFECFEEDPELGIASGTYTEPAGNGWIVHTIPEGYALGAVRMYRAECLAAVVEAVSPMVSSPACDTANGKPSHGPTLSWDSIDHLYAEEAGWQTRCFHDLVVVHHRTEGARTHVLKGLFEQGVVSYAMGYLPLFALARSMRKMLEYPVVVGALALNTGYLWGALHASTTRADERTRRLVRERQKRRLHGFLAFGRTKRAEDGRA